MDQWDMVRSQLDRHLEARDKDILDMMAAADWTDLKIVKSGKVDADGWPIGSYVPRQPME
jgi:hypothetical protein